MSNRHLIAAGVITLLAVAGCTKSAPAPQVPSSDASASAETTALKEVTLECPRHDMTPRLSVDRRGCARRSNPYRAYGPWN